MVVFDAWMASIDQLGDDPIGEAQKFFLFFKKNFIRSNFFPSFWEGTNLHCISIQNVRIYESGYLIFGFVLNTIDGLQLLLHLFGSHC